MKKSCDDCRWSQGSGWLAQCRAPENKEWPWCEIQREDGWFWSRALHCCGRSGRWFKPKEQDDGGHRTTVEAASGGADQATNPNSGATTASAGATVTGTKSYVRTGLNLAAWGPPSPRHVLPGHITYVASAAQAAAAHAYLRAQAGKLESSPKIEDAGITLGEIVAWRAWRVKYGFIMSTYVDEGWLPGEPMEGDVDAGAGVHAWKSPHKALTYLMQFTGGDGASVEAMAIGRVALWGTVVEHERGYRAQYAKPLSFDQIVGFCKEPDALLADLRKRYKTEDA